jgi:hypothetical protein
MPAQRDIVTMDWELGEDRHASEKASVFPGERRSLWFTATGESEHLGHL